MKNNETGEFELVLGNNQLVVGFLIVALLFGVAFAMGYIVGRSSTPSAKLQAENSASAANVPGKDTRPQPASQAPPAQAPATPPPDQPAAPAADQPAPPATAPADTTPPPPQPVREAPPVAAASDSPSEPAPGSYWQVLATKNHNSAEAMQTGLKEKGLPSTLGPGPEGLVRVLVGPYADAQALGRAKTVLENAGLHPVLKRE